MFHTIWGDTCTCNMVALHILGEYWYIFSSVGVVIPCSLLHVCDHVSFHFSGITRDTFEGEMTLQVHVGDLESRLHIVPVYQHLHS